MIFGADQERRQRIEELLRVDHAGEYGAVRIYEGQLAVLGRSSVGPLIEVGTCCARAASTFNPVSTVHCLGW